MGQEVPKERHPFRYTALILGLILAAVVGIGAQAHAATQIPVVQFFPGRNVVLHVTTSEIGFSFSQISKGMVRIYINKHNVLDEPTAPGQFIIFTDAQRLRLGKNIFSIVVTHASYPPDREKVTVYRDVPTEVKARLATTGTDSSAADLYTGSIVLLVGLLMTSTSKKQVIAKAERSAVKGFLCRAEQISA
jgi:hypothetical protein